MAELGVDEAKRALKEAFGFNQFRPGQEQVVGALLTGRPVLAVFPTGGGKSLCYQLPGMMLPGVTLVVSPLIALMKDQVDWLLSRGIAAARLDSSLEPAQSREVIESLQAGRLKLLYVAPERLASERFLRTLARSNVAMLAVDEAHCISEWGHNFRPEYLKVAQVASRLGVARVLALTATATPEVAREVAQAFGVAQADMVVTGFHRPNLELHASPCASGQREEKLVARLKARPKGPTIVYVTLQKTAEHLAERLRAEGFDAMPYHAGMKDEDRHATQDRFMRSEGAVVVATIAFGMGIDKADIRAVYHFNLPKSLENYAQEIGRGGRDGALSYCEMFACEEDALTLGNFTYGDTPTPGAVAGLLAEILEQGETFGVSVYEVSQRHDIRPLVVRTFLTYLELEGVLESTGPFYNEVKFRPQRPSTEILARYDEARASFLRQLFRRARQGRIWFTLDVAAAAEALDESRERINAAMGYLEEQGDLELQLAGLHLGYRRCATTVDESGLIDRLSGRFLEREERDIARVRSILEFAQSSDCLTAQLLRYFGEELPGRCGHCARCLGIEPERVPKPVEREPGPIETRRLTALTEDRHPALATSRQLARYLCGLSSPATTRARLTGRPEFGMLADIAFPRVMDWVESQ